jgi:DNA-binding NtrC family response regulator
MMAILVVDDDRALLDGLTSLFEVRLPGTRIETCESAEAAFERLENSHYDVLISDIKLPGGGLNVLRAAKRVRPGMPVLMISGSGTPDLKRSVLRMGALDLIEKPFDRDQLMQAVVSAAVSENKTKSRAVDHCNQQRGTRNGLESVESRQVVGIPSEQISSVAREMAADLVGVGTHGWAGLNQILLSRSAERVIKEAPCPHIRGSDRSQPQP